MQYFFEGGGGNLARYTPNASSLTGIFTFYHDFIFLQEFLEFLVEWLALWKFSNFRIFRKFSHDIFIPFVPVSNFSVLWIGWMKSAHIVNGSLCQANVHAHSLRNCEINYCPQTENWMWKRLSLHYRGSVLLYKISAEIRHIPSLN